VLLYGLGPEWAQAPMLVLIVAAGFTALVVGVRRHLPSGSHRRPWWLMFAALVCFLLGIVLREAVPGASNHPPGVAALVPDLFVLPGYGLMAYAFIDILRCCRATDDDPATVDAILAGIAAAFMMWTYFISPQLYAANLSAVATVSAFFPVVDVALLVLIMQLLLAGGSRTPALWMLIVGAGVVFAGDLLFSLHENRFPTVDEQMITAMFLVSYLAPGAAALHPSMRSLTEPQHNEIDELGSVRTAFIAVLIGVPTVVTTLEPITTVWDGIVRAGLCVLLTLVVLQRVVRANNYRALAERSSRRRATHDALTDLPNRELLAETIAGWGARASDEGQEISLLFLDLDRFKMVNDHWGHQVGDELLCAVAGRLGAQVRSEDLVCRIGGDEFVIALASPSHTALAESLAGRLLTEFTKPFELSVGSVVVTPSIGVARSAGAAGALELIRDADTAMYKAKGSGRNAYAVFDTSLRDQVRSRMNLEQALRGALERGELSVHYQPIIDLATDELDGFEALMRWNHPELGAVSPLEFIPIAEETGLIVESGAWLLEEAAGQLVTWRAQRPRGARPLHISVNVSVRQLRDVALVRTVRDVLQRTGLPPEALWLEITESGVMEDLEAAVATLCDLRELGVTLCIDDFGTGYSSLSYLNRLPVGILKVDRSFVAGVGENGPNEPIVRAVLAMTRAMDVRVVAEGVETAVQRDWLRSQSCELAQGWLYGAPRPPDALDDWLRRPPGSPQVGERSAITA
jgi:diguanylate cyclase (GGDEF)-like protein